MALSKSVCKLCLFIFNAIFIVAGIAIFAVGVWTAADKVYISDVVDNNSFEAAAYLIIIAGIIVIGVCILGFISLAKEKKILVIVYFAIWILIFLFLMVGGILAVVFRAELESGMKDAMKKTLTELYGHTSTAGQRDTTTAWNRMQHDLRCCAVDNDDWGTYKFTQWYLSQDDRLREKPFVPASCCVYDERSGAINDQDKCQYWQLGPPGNPFTQFKNTALYYQGCYEAAKNFIMDSSEAIVAVGFAFGLTLIFGMVFTVLFLRHIGNIDDEEIRRRQRSKTPNDGL
ncbi:hypothetical protein SNE40_003153 [Patella caerulea]|uniref:Tetraspanin n=1 Tax=Patella caerulea TaxID=87958 RepID=A0AAN8KDA3_PATCE